MVKRGLHKEYKSNPLMVERGIYKQAKHSLQETRAVQKYQMKSCHDAH